MKTPVGFPVAAILLFLTACASEPHLEPSSTDSGEPVAVRVATVERQELASPIPVVGSVRARRSVVISSRVMSQIRAIHADEGDLVGAGSRLVDLDDRELVSAVEAAEAQRGAAGKTVLAAGHAVESAQARLQLAEATFHRFEELVAKDSVTRQEYDRALAGLREARAGVASGESQREQAVFSEARAKAAISAARVMLSFARIDSPINGIVTRRHQDPGSLAVPGEPILTLEETGRYRLHVAVPESLISRVQVGQVLPVKVAAGPTQQALQSTVVEIAPEVDVASRTFVVKMALPDLPGLRSGAYGRAVLAGEPRPVLVVPVEAVREEGQIRSVFVVDENRVGKRLVTVGAARDGAYEVLSGLAEGERIVLDPQKLSDGARVRIIAAAPEYPPPETVPVTAREKVDG